MPELPEVEGFKVITERHLVGRTVRRVRRLDGLMLREPGPTTFRRRLVGAKVTRVQRHGKQLLVFTADRGPVLGLHFGMTGHPVVEGDDHPWDRLIIDLDDGPPYRYRNSRRLGAVRLLAHDDVFDLLWRLGPDALEAPREWFVDAVATRRAAVKALLLDQGFLAGVGNLYADEALLAAGIAPGRPAASLSVDEARALWRELRRILSRAVRAHRAGRDARFPLMDRRGSELGCPRCERGMRRSTIGGRTTYWCPRCQR